MSEIKKKRINTDADMQTDRAHILLGRLRNEIENAKPAPLSDKVLVDKQEVLNIVDKLTDIMDRELKEYREVTDKRARIISEAKTLSDKIKYEAEKSASRIRVTKRRPGETAPFRVAELKEDERGALRTANDIYAASLIYTDEMLTEVDHLVNDSYSKIKQEYARMTDALQAKIEALTKNRQELMNDLDDLSKMDRYSQIIELSDLLSNELYHEKLKAKVAEKLEREKAEKEAAEKAAREAEKKEEEKEVAFDPERKQVKVERKKAERPDIKVMDRSEESKGRDE